MNLGGAELLIVIAVVVLLFGAGWLPKAARNLGKAKVELDRTKEQLEDTKRQVVEATGLHEIESTVRKANRALNTSPQGLLKGAAASAMRPPKAASAGPADIAAPADADDAEIVDTESGDHAAPPRSDTNVNIDFSDDR